MDDIPPDPASIHPRTCKWCAAPIAVDGTRCSACNRSHSPGLEEIRPIQRVSGSSSGPFADKPFPSQKETPSPRWILGKTASIFILFGLAWAAGLATSRDGNPPHPEPASVPVPAQSAPSVQQALPAESKMNVVIRKISADTLEFGGTTVTFTAGKMVIHGANSDISIPRKDHSGTSLLYILADPTARVPSLADRGDDTTRLRAIPNTDAPDPDSFPRFSFFDPTPSTIGVLVYPPSSDDHLTTADLVLFDLSSNRFARVPVGPTGKPLWISTSSYPPTLGIGISVFLGSSGSSPESTTRIQSVLRFQSNSFVADAGLTRAYLTEHFDDADLTLSERAELQATPLKELPPALCNKLTERLFYGSLLGKDEELHTLLVSLERTTQDEGEILVNAYLRPPEELPVTPEPEVSTSVTPISPIPTLPGPDQEVLATARLAVEAANRGNYRKALELWTELAEKGDAPSQYNLGRLYARGNGVRQDFGQARLWFEKAALQGYGDAQLKLGMLYYFGDGVPINREQARTLFEKAALQGNREAMDFLKKLERPQN